MWKNENRGCYMLKLKYLFDNKDLAQMVLSYWNYDESDENFLKDYRISSNAVYWCKNNDEVFFLRFAPVKEKNEKSLRAELKLLQYLKQNTFACAQPIVSKKGNLLELVQTPWGDYYAVAFEKAKGRQMSQIELDLEMCFDCGVQLGKLHRLTQETNQEEFPFENWRDKLIWIQGVLEDEADDSKALIAYHRILSGLENLEINEANYGLIHYDYELDNLFYNQDTRSIEVIDFEDAHYHWYGVDRMIAMENLLEDIPEEKIPQFKEAFLKGYASENQLLIDSQTLNLFADYINLHSYAKLKYVLEEQWDFEPQWLVGLREKLERAIQSKYNQM